MRGRPILTCALCGLLAGCESSYNPVNWFGGGDEAEIALAADGLPVNPQNLIDQVTGVVLERAPGGVILRATGLPPTMGFWNAALVPVDPDLRPDENGVLALDFRALPPPTPQPAGAPAAREIVAGYFLTEQTLRGVRTVSVRGERNARDIRP
jgi:hypothetical protein